MSDDDFAFKVPASGKAFSYNLTTPTPLAWAEPEREAQQWENPVQQAHDAIRDHNAAQLKKQYGGRKWKFL